MPAWVMTSLSLHLLPSSYQCKCLNIKINRQTRILLAKLWVPQLYWPPALFCNIFLNIWYCKAKRFRSQFVGVSCAYDTTYISGTQLAHHLHGSSITRLHVTNVRLYIPLACLPHSTYDLFSISITRTIDFPTHQAKPTTNFQANICSERQYFT